MIQNSDWKIMFINKWWLLEINKYIWKTQFSKNSIYLFIYLSTEANAISITDSTDLNQLYRWMGNCFMYPNMYMYSGTPPIKLNNRELYNVYVWTVHWQHSVDLSALNLILAAHQSKLWQIKMVLQIACSLDIWHGSNE